MLLCANGWEIVGGKKWSIPTHYKQPRPTLQSYFVQPPRVVEGGVQLNKKLMFVVNVDWFFISHRLPIALAARDAGYEVHVAAGITDRLAELERHGFIVHPLNIVRGATGFGSNLASLLEIYSLFRRLRPDIAHLVTIKPVLLGGIAARMARITGVLAAISGLGFVFVARGWRHAFRQAIVGRLYSLALGARNQIVVFQNLDDLNRVSDFARLPRRNAALIRGSGVSLDSYVNTPMPEGVPLVMMAARLLSDKGVWEFVDAARMLQDQGVPARFCLVGSIDADNPSSLTTGDFEKIRAAGHIELWGQRDDMASILSKATIVVLPSYREGLPKVLIEAAACGRAVVTTDVPGCRDAITPGVTGLLVPDRDAQALAVAIRSLLDDPHLCEEMGKAGRALAEREFDIRSVVDAHLRIYGELLADAR